MLHYATDICNKEALKNQRRDFVSNVLTNAHLSCVGRHSPRTNMQFRPLMVFASSILGPICDVVQSTGECRIEAGAPASDDVAGSCQ
jgi:hypothetical protein